MASFFIEAHHERRLPCQGGAARAAIEGLISGAFREEDLGSSQNSTPTGTEGAKRRRSNRWLSELACQSSFARKGE